MEKQMNVSVDLLHGPDKTIYEFDDGKIVVIKSDKSILINIVHKDAAVADAMLEQIKTTYGRQA
jgi:hypothetical protein